MSVLIPSTRPTLQVGGRVFTDLTNLIVLGTRADGGQFGTFRDLNTNAGYQVTTGKTLTIHAARMIPRDGGITTHGNIFYGGNDVGLNSASAPTTPVYPIGDSSFIVLKALLGTTGVPSDRTLEASNALNWDFQVPQSMYPQFTVTGSSALCIAYGYENDL